MSTIYIGRMIKHLRDEKGLSIRECSEGIMSTYSLSNVENGKTKIKREKLHSIAERLGDSISQFDFFIVSTTDNETIKQVEHFVKLIDTLKFNEAVEQIDYLDKVLLCLNYKMVYLYYKSICFLNMHRIKEFDALNKEIDVFVPTIETPLGYFFYWRFKVNHNLFYQKNEKAFEILQHLENLPFTPASLLYYSTLLKAIVMYYEEEKNYVKAIEYCQRWYSLVQNKHKETACELLVKMSDYSVLLNNVERGIVDLKKILQVAENLELPMLIGRCMYNLGNAFQLQGDMRQAVEYWKASLHFKRRASDTFVTLTSLMALSRYYLDEKLPELSAVYIQDGMKISTELDDQHEYHIFKFLYVEYLLQIEQLERVTPMLEECEAFFKKHSKVEQLKQLYKLKGTYYYKMKKYKKSAEAFLRHFEMKI